MGCFRHAGLGTKCPVNRANSYYDIFQQKVVPKVVYIVEQIHKWFPCNLNRDGEETLGTANGNDAQLGQRTYLSLHRIWCLSEVAFVADLMFLFACGFSIAFCR